MAATRQNLIDAMVAYLKDQSNTIATYLDAASVRGVEYINKKYTNNKGEGLVSIPDVQVMSRANAGNRDEIYPLFVSLGLYQRSKDDGSAVSIQSIVTSVREELNADFQGNRDTLWTYFEPLDTGDEVLSLKFNRVQLGVPNLVIGADNQTATMSFNIMVYLTRDVS